MAGKVRSGSPVVELESTVIASGDRVILRDPLPSDLPSQLRWRTQGEWRHYDAPWELVTSPMIQENEDWFRTRFLKRCEEARTTPRSYATIATTENHPLGWVTRYREDRYPAACWVGIDIAEDEYLNHGFGREALGLWIHYLFSNSEMHRIGLDTWSLNPRMVRVAKRLGFIFEGAEREVMNWQGEWLDRLHFGILRGEWEVGRLL